MGSAECTNPCRGDGGRVKQKGQGNRSRQQARTENMEKKYKLGPGTQVRKEGFGLLFYTMQGPRLYFLSSGPLLDSKFFEGKRTLGQYLKDRPLSRSQSHSLECSLDRLREKGVLLEC